MYYYFSSEQPSALKINGIYLGLLHNTVKFFNSQEQPFVEILPIDGKGETLAFLIDKVFLSRPPKNLTVTDLKGGYLLHAEQQTEKSEFIVLTQKKFYSSVVTVFRENGLKISIETPNDFFAETLNFNCEHADLLEFSLNGQNFVLAELVGKDKRIEIYSVQSKIKKVYSDFIESFSLDDGLTTTTKLKDIAKHVVTKNWEYTEGQLRVKKVDIKKADTFEVARLPHPLIPFAFFEELLIGGEIKEYLCESMIDNADKLRGYVGNFIGVMPPPLFRRSEEIGLIYKKDEGVYFVDYFTVTLNNGKIENLRRLDD